MRSPLRTTAPSGRPSPSAPASASSAANRIDRDSLVVVLSFLTVHGLLQCARVCRAWQAGAATERLWLALQPCVTNAHGPHLPLTREHHMQNLDAVRRIRNAQIRPDAESACTIGDWAAAFARGWRRVRLVSRRLTQRDGFHRPENFPRPGELERRSVASRLFPEVNVPLAQVQSACEFVRIAQAWQLRRMTEEHIRRTAQLVVLLLVVRTCVSADLLWTCLCVVAFLAKTTDLEHEAACIPSPPEWLPLLLDLGYGFMRHRVDWARSLNAMNTKRRADFFRPGAVSVQTRVLILAHDVSRSVYLHLSQGYLLLLCTWASFAHVLLAASPDASEDRIIRYTCIARSLVRWVAETGLATPRDLDLARREPLVAWLFFITPQCLVPAAVVALLGLSFLSGSLCLAWWCGLAWHRLCRFSPSPPTPRQSPRASAHTPPPPPPQAPYPPHPHQA